MRLKKNGYKAVVDTVYVSDKGKRRFHYLLMPEPVKVTITTNVPAAQLTVDGRSERITGQRKVLFLTPGMHVVSVSKKGFTRSEQSVNLRANQAQNIAFNLLPLKGKIAVLVLPWGNIYLDGQLKKRETNIREYFVLPAGKHTLKITHPTFGECREIIEVQPDTTLSFVYNFKVPQPVRVLAFDETNRPQYAQILVDGKAMNQYTPGIVKLSLGKHQVFVRKKGFTVIGQPKSVMVLPDKALVLKFRLRKNP